VTSSVSRWLNGAEHTNLHQAFVAAK